LTSAIESHIYDPSINEVVTKAYCVSALYLRFIVARCVLYPRFMYNHTPCSIKNGIHGTVIVFAILQRCFYFIFSKFRHRSKIFSHFPARFQIFRTRSEHRDRMRFDRVISIALSRRESHSANIEKSLVEHLASITSTALKGITLYIEQGTKRKNSCLLFLRFLYLIKSIKQ